jgi:ferric-dicitrate binding protein FerR (iron transport regulator)
MESMIHQSDIELLERFTRGITTPEEERYIRTLFDEQEESLWFKNHLESEWNTYHQETPSGQQDLTHMLDRVHHMIHIREKQEEQTLVHRLYRWYSVAAAILLIPVLIVAGLWITRKGEQPESKVERLTATLVAPRGSRIAFTLPDGTKGWLNSGSCMEYSLPFADERKVSLRGEAWFDVAGDEIHPFEIAAGKSSVVVLGTKFNLNAYPAENYVEVALEEGKVEFSSPELAAPLVMKPDERLVLRNHAVTLNATEASKYSAWVEGKLVFRGDPMPEVARRLERWYNVKVEIIDKELENDVIRGTFQDDSLEEVLRLLSMTSPIKYRIIERKVLPDGTFEKERVMLYRKEIRK